MKKLLVLSLICFVCTLANARENFKKVDTTLFSLRLISDSGDTICIQAADLVKIDTVQHFLFLKPSITKVLKDQHFTQRSAVLNIRGRLITINMQDVFSSRSDGYSHIGTINGKLFFSEADGLLIYGKAWGEIAKEK